MDMPVDSPAAGQQQQQQQHGTLQFEEDLKDIPQALSHYSDPSHGAALAVGAPGASGQPNIAQFPSVLAPAPQGPVFSPAPGIPVNQAPQNMAPLVPQPGSDGQQPPLKRPRGRPRKVPGTENRSLPGTPGAAGEASGRGRPKARGKGRGRGRGRGRGGKRARVSSDDEDYGADLTPSDTDAEGEDDDGTKSVDLNQEVDDDFGGEGKIGPMTKFGRKISKPKSFVPTNKPTIQRKKRAPQVINLDAHLMCEVCRQGHSPPENRLVICEACNKGWHQLCSVPQIEASVVDSVLPWFCSACDAKIAATKAPLDVAQGEWTTGAGEDKGEGKEGERDAEYAEEVKREWLEGLPLHSLVGYVLSVEKKFAPLVSDSTSTTSLPIWPLALPTTLAEAKAERAREEAERQAALERQAEELAAAAAGLESTPAVSEVGTPLSFDPLPGDAPARTAASRRAEAEAQQQAQQAQAGPSGLSGGAVPQALPQQQAYSSAPGAASFATHQQPPAQQRQAVPAFMRANLAVAPALGGSASPQPQQQYGAPADIPVGAAPARPAGGVAGGFSPYPAVSAAASPYAGYAGAYGATGAYGTNGVPAIQPGLDGYGTPGGQGQ